MKAANSINFSTSNGNNAKAPYLFLSEARVTCEEQLICNELDFNEEDRKSKPESSRHTLNMQDNRG
ncbi:hypothetical protein L4D76_06865 [Photobacterium sagamiensis]|uniref:hypothetical protein n=1 Tax=Photobacterium sagamiensis TaxID=2910241 RepID=UPI003D150466